MYSVTIFRNIFDNKTDKRMDFSTWEEFENLFYQLSTQKYSSKKDAYLISPATYVEGTTRSNKNVVSWASWAAVDVDDHVFSGDLQSSLIDKYGKYYFVCYSTASSRIDFPKFRLVFPLSTPVENKFIKKFWYALSSELDDIVDKQTKDLSRMYYIPGQYENANNFIFSNKKGIYIDPIELMDKYPYVQVSKSNSFLDNLPEEVQLQLIQHRKNQLKNRDKYSWSSLRDCPFVNKTLIAQYKSISETGWYHKMYQFMVSVAFNSIRKGYPITEDELEKLARELDRETGNWYEKRPLNMEAGSALNYAYKNSNTN